jgi:hypothetical protein
MVRIHHLPPLFLRGKNWILSFIFNDFPSLPAFRNVRVRASGVIGMVAGLFLVLREIL